MAQRVKVFGLHPLLTKQIRIAMPKKISLIGKTFGRLKVVGDAPNYISPKGQQYRKVLCECECGTVIESRLSQLKNGHTTSCGCFQKEQLLKSITKHGGAVIGKHHPVYDIWRSMTQRCLNPKTPSFHRYGGRGIVCCEQWRHSFETFSKDVLECAGERPSMSHTLDRWPLRNGNYEPGNVRWATKKEQARNTAQNKVFTVRGVTGCISELSEHFKIRSRAVIGRLNLGWNPESAFTEPVELFRKGPRRLIARVGVSQNYQTKKGSDAVLQVPVKTTDPLPAVHVPAMPKVAESCTTSAAIVVAPLIAAC